MAIVRAEGFFHFDSNADWAAKGHHSGNGTSWSTTGGRGNRGRMTCALFGDAWMVLPSSYTTLYHHFATQMHSLHGCKIAGFGDSTYTHILIQTLSDGSFTVYRAGFFASGDGGPELDPTGATTLGTTDPGLLRGSTYHQFQVKVVLHASAGEVTVKLDGVQVFTFTGNTINSNAPTSTITQIGFGDNSGASDVDYCDVCVCDTSGGVHDTYLGDVAVYESVSPVDGDELQWTRSTGAGTWSSHVDENPQDGDTSYLRSTANGDRNCFSFPTVSSSIGTVLAVKETFCLAKEDPAFGAVKLYSRSDDDVDHDGSTKTITEDYIFIERIFDKDAKDDSSWSIAKVNATQLGVDNAS